MSITTRSWPGLDSAWCAATCGASRRFQTPRRRSEPRVTDGPRAATADRFAGGRVHRPPRSALSPMSPDPSAPRALLLTEALDSLPDAVTVLDYEFRVRY